MIDYAYPGTKYILQFGKQVVLNKVWVKHWEYKSWITFKCWVWKCENHVNRFFLKCTFIKIYIYHFPIYIFIKIKSQSYVLEIVSLSKMTSFRVCLAELHVALDLKKTALFLIFLAKCSSSVNSRFAKSVDQAPRSTKSMEHLMGCSINS
jgi:hypothetical protein